METKYAELIRTITTCQHGTPEYYIVRKELVSVERELIAKVLSGDTSFDHTIRNLPNELLEAATDTHYSSETSICEFREDNIDWFRVNGYADFADRLERCLTTGEYC